MAAMATMPPQLPVLQLPCSSGMSSIMLDNQPTEQWAANLLCRVVLFCAAAVTGEGGAGGSSSSSSNAFNAKLAPHGSKIADRTPASKADAAGAASPSSCLSHPDDFVRV